MEPTHPDPDPERPANATAYPDAGEGPGRGTRRLGPNALALATAGVGLAVLLLVAGGASAHFGNHRPMISRINVVDAPPTTHYYAQSIDMDGDFVTFTWDQEPNPPEKSTCTDFTVVSDMPPLAEAEWFHGFDSGCRHDTVRHEGDVTFAVSDGTSTHRRMHVYGTAEGPNTRHDSDLQVQLSDRHDGTFELQVDNHGPSGTGFELFVRVEDPNTHLMVKDIAAEQLGLSCSHEEAPSYHVHCWGALSPASSKEAVLAGGTRNLLEPAECVFSVRIIGKVIDPDLSNNVDEIQLDPIWPKLDDCPSLDDEADGSSTFPVLPAVLAAVAVPVAYRRRR